MPELIGRKRDGAALTADELRWIIEGFAADTIPDYQMSALMMAIIFRGMTSDELSVWADAMLRSGDVLDFSDVAAPKVDKHSTGGVGDKVSIPLAPIVAACGVAVPMMSGRGLGHTGGTLDKLESIPGFRTALDPDEFGSVLRKHGLVLAGQSETLVPADRRLYRLRDASGTVPSVPLIASSIMSKKLAEGLDALVLDVKVGRGAFMKTVADATTLANTMVDLGAHHGTAVTAVLTHMDQPLGAAVGNALEIVESIEILRGGGPEDMIDIVVTLGIEMLIAGGITDDRATAGDMIASVIEDGSALAKFAAVIEAQDGDPTVLEQPQVLPTAASTQVLPAPESGFVKRCDALDIGVASVRLGGGRQKIDDTVDPAVGIVLHAKVGDKVAVGDPLATIHFNDDDRLAAARPLLEAAWDFGDEPIAAPPLVIDTLRR